MNRLGLSLFSTLLVAVSLFAETASSVFKSGVHSIGTTLVIGEGSSVIVEPGATLRFKAGTGIDVRGGRLQVSGTPEKPVLFEGEDGALWNGISVSGMHKANLNHLLILGSEYGVVVENGFLDLADVDIHGSSKIGLYARTAKVNVRGGSFNYNANIALWVDEGGLVNMDDVILFGNEVAAFFDIGSRPSLQNCSVENNNFGIVNREGNSLKMKNSNESFVENNKVGLVMEDSPSQDLKVCIRGNEKDFSQNLNQAVSALPERPENEYAFAAKPFSMEQDDSLNAGWSLEGSMTVTGGYHGIYTEKNESGEIFVSGSDTVDVGEKYENYFQVPGFFSTLNAYMILQSPYNQTVEFSASLSTDKWNNFNPENVLAVYRDGFQKLSLGDVYVSEGDVYLSGVNFLGASYGLNLFKNSAGSPLFEILAFGGETRETKLLGDKNKDVYKDYIEDGEIEAQQMIVGGKLRWNMHRRFNGSLGFIGGKDYLEDPFLRDGSSNDVNTATPLTSSKTFFADGNWLFFPGDVELNGQVAIGAADTANAKLQRALDKVFTSAGLDISNASRLRKLMNNPTQIDLLSRSELEEIFGDNTMMTSDEMRTALKKYVSEAKSVLRNFEANEDDPAEIKDWDGENFAFKGSLRWDLGKTLIEGHVQFVGSDFYSAGSPDLVQNSREVYGNLKQKITDFWKLEFAYKLNVENAAHNADYNIFGLAEGSKAGIVPGASDSYLEEHEQDENRTLYEHNATLGNEFKVLDFLTVSVGYSMNYRNRSTNQRLYANYSGTSGIFEDSWFSPRSSSTVNVVSLDDTLKIDSLRWAKYRSLTDEEYLATQFEERIIRHRANLLLKFDLPSNVLKMQGIWTYRYDMSRFVQDDLLKGFDFSDETYGILGYYFHGGDYFEQNYSASLLSALKGFRNMLGLSFRYKDYNRDDMDDYEWKLTENLEINIVPKFMDLTISGLYREEILHWDEDGEKNRELEVDVGASMSLGFKHNERFSSTWTAGTLMNYRPDRESEQYLDLYGMVSLNYTF